ncbi:hypothetical protein VST7929_01991 [Vibrio stylophorae]|uniref:CheW-like domain-containing protein n=1 Tax=Vibrio stylophorae TaxID=659351 RepID=A0ABM8ZUT3_9VIBR|nr:chemotaxis protein CheW [Vibrio stylophorae]CAH0534090.1 hypothetical protein VST7929_01991 [Vibrio stylophorae]
MSTNRAPLNSEQALDDYFMALLEEDEVPAQLEMPTESEVPPEVQLAVQPQPAAVSASAKPYVELESDKQIQLQRLLSQVSTETVPQLAVAVETETKTETETKVETETLSDQLDPDWQAALVEEAAHDAATQVQLAEPEVAVETLVDTVVETEVETKAETVVEALETTAVDIAVDTEVATELAPAEKALDSDWHNIETGYEFQVLYFLIAGVTFAVPLNNLGGIHRLAETNILLGRPAWYLGLQTSREQQLDVVDTARWVMPDKITDDQHREDYQYIVMLGDSKWGLASDKLMGTETLVKEDVRWRESEGKRPWLAGMVKEKMCALIHVEAMINMLNAGLDVNGVA